LGEGIGLTAKDALVDHFVVRQGTKHLCPFGIDGTLGRFQIKTLAFNLELNGLIEVGPGLLIHQFRHCSVPFTHSVCYRLSAL
jgi:hypothetical protein